MPKYAWLIWGALVVCILAISYANAIQGDGNGGFTLDPDEQSECIKGGGCLLVTVEQIKEIQTYVNALKKRAESCRS